MRKSATSFQPTAARSALRAGRRTWLQASQRVLRAAEGAVSEVLHELEQHGTGAVRGAHTTDRMREVVTRDRAAASADGLADEAEERLTGVPPLASAPASPALPRPAARSRPETGTAGDEPIRTRTYARLLFAQGEPRRALAIYLHLMDENPRDASLAAEAMELRRMLELDAVG